MEVESFDAAFRYDATVVCLDGFSNGFKTGYREKLTPMIASSCAVAASAATLRVTIRSSSSC